MTEELSRERQAEPDGLRRYRDTCTQHTHAHTPLRTLSKAQRDISSIHNHIQSGGWMHIHTHMHMHTHPHTHTT